METEEMPEHQVQQEMSQCIIEEDTIKLLSFNLEDSANQVWRAKETQVVKKVMGAVVKALTVAQRVMAIGEKLHVGVMFNAKENTRARIALQTMMEPMANPECTHHTIQVLGKQL